MKPFKAPSVVRRTPSNTQQPVDAGPPAKKRRVSPEAEDDQQESVLAAAKVLKSKPAQNYPKFSAPAARKPLAVVDNPSSSSGTEVKDDSEGYYNVLW